MFENRRWLSLSVKLLIVSVSISICKGSSEFEDQLQLLSKQVKALLDRRKEDLQIIENSLINKLVKNFENSDIHEDVKSLR